MENEYVIKDFEASPNSILMMNSIDYWYCSSCGGKNHQESDVCCHCGE